MNKNAYTYAVSFLACCLAIGACSSTSSDKPDAGGTGSGGGSGVDGGGPDHPGGTGGDVSGTGGRGTGGVQGGTGGSNGTGGAVAPCNDLPNTAPVVTAMRLAQDPPIAPAGGDFVEGTYFQTSTIYYTGPGGSTVPPGYTAKVTAVISRGATAGTFNYQDVESINAAVTRDTLLVVPNGTAFAGTHLCPTTGTLGGFQYTVTATGFILYSIVLGTVDTYARQP
jgi:hypothetical protein